MANANTISRTDTLDARDSLECKRATDLWILTTSSIFTNLALGGFAKFEENCLSPG